MKFFAEISPQTIGSAVQIEDTGDANDFHRSGAANKDASEKDECAAKDDLGDREPKAQLEIAIANVADRDKLECNDHVREVERCREVRNKEGERVENTAEEGGDTDDATADRRVPAPRMLARVGEPLCKCHRDASADRRCGTDEEGDVSAAARECCRKERGKGRNGAVNESDKGGLYDFEKELAVDVLNVEGLFDVFYRAIHEDAV